MDAGGTRGGLKAEINVTPLVDVVLVLLIIFMVVTPMLQESKAVELPQASEVERGKDDARRLSVVVDQAGQVFLDGIPVEDGLVAEMVAMRLEADPGLEVLVKGDKRLEYGDVRRIMSGCREAGAKRVVLATQERKLSEGE